MKKKSLSEAQVRPRTVRVTKSGQVHVVIFCCKGVKFSTPSFVNAFLVIVILFSPRLPTGGYRFPFI